ncbi:MAG: bifunctional 4-hydroxy-2-oxoglutarate aldolase/2-dehydro-3-deoxy-phosphogluconate aldolase [Planktomarina sp.]
MTPDQMTPIIAATCRKAPVVPVIVIDDVKHARPLAESLVSGGLPALEVTLRTPVALEAISEMAKVEGAIPGVGSLRTPDDVKRAKEAGAQFGVSPGATPTLLNAAETHDMPLLPGCATASEAMALLERGYEILKFFPASINGGPKAMAAISAPLPQIKFCPTGGVSLQNAPDYLALPCTLCVGGSWVAPKSLMAAGDWKAITELAQEAATLMP